jgi:ketosteroid isomerase-like protein
MSQSILDMEQAAMERWRNGDPMGFVEISAEDICYVDPGRTQPIIGLEAYRPFMKSLEGQIHFDRSEFIDPQLVMMGDAALLSYNFRSLVLTPAGEVNSQTPWNCTEVYFRRAGEWRIVHNHWSFIHQKLPELVEIPLPVHSAKVEYQGLLGELMSLETAAMQRWDHGEVNGFLELSDPSVTYFDTGTPRRINGKAALEAEYRLREGKISYQVMDFIDPWVLASGDMAVLFYRFLSTHLSPDGAVASRVAWNCSEVFTRREAGWKIIHTHWSFIGGSRAEAIQGIED